MKRYRAHPFVSPLSLLCDGNHCKCANEQQAKEIAAVTTHKKWRVGSSALECDVRECRRFGDQRGVLECSYHSRWPCVLSTATNSSGFRFVLLCGYLRSKLWELLTDSGDYRSQVRILRQNRRLLPTSYDRERSSGFALRVFGFDQRAYLLDTQVGDPSEEALKPVDGKPSRPNATVGLI
jgi:hypothetical protein